VSNYLTPVLATLGRRAAARWEKGGDATSHPDPETGSMEHHIVICGFGTVGQIVACVLEGAKVPFVGLDTNGKTVAKEYGANRRIIFGDASRIELLESAGGRGAAAFVITPFKRHTTERIVEAVRCLQPKAMVFAGLLGDVRAKRVADKDPVGAMPEEIEVSFILAAQVLKHLGLTDHAVEFRFAAMRANFSMECEEAAETTCPGAIRASAPSRTVSPPVTGTASDA
jgi:voltage-gated potassium channel Kch